VQVLSGNNEWLLDTTIGASTLDRKRRNGFLSGNNCSWDTAIGATVGNVLALSLLVISLTAASIFFPIQINNKPQAQLSKNDRVFVVEYDKMVTKISISPLIRTRKI